jgi:hypothetical protein
LVIIQNLKVVVSSLRYFHIGEEDDFYVNQQGNGVVEDHTFFDVALNLLLVLNG